MKKVITKLWSVGLILVLLISTLLISVAPASAGNYAFTADLSQPTNLNAGLAPGSAYYSFSATVTTTLVGNADGFDESFTFGYTDQDGVASVGTIVVPALAIATTVVPVTLAAGDWGIRAVLSSTDLVTDATAGVVTIWSSDGTAVTAQATITFAGPAVTTLAWIANNPIGGFNVVDADQSGSVMYLLGNDGTGLNYLYRSPDNGNTWAPCVGALPGGLFLPNVVGTDVWSKIAVSPDDPNVMVLINNLAALDNVYLSTDGGANFSILTAPATVIINDAAISYEVNGLRQIAIGGTNVGTTVAGVEYWTMGMVAPVWTAIAPPNGVDNTLALEFSTNYPADSGLIVVGLDNSTGSVIGAQGVYVDVYSFNLLAYNPAGYNFPRTVHTDTGGVITSNRMQIALDANFYLGDETTQIGFIGGQITDSGGFEAGGVWRFDYAGVAGLPLTKILGGTTALIPGTAIHSVAWDGTNLMAGVQAAVAGAVQVQHCANPLAASGWIFLGNSPFKAPGTGTLPLVIFNDAGGYCFSTGTNSAVARTLDYGATFNGIALVNSNFCTVLDFWVSPDGTRTYVVTGDGADVNIWRKDNGAWQRVMILVGLTGQAWMVRGDTEAPDTVFLGRQGFTTMFKSLDGGEYLWTQRASSIAIRDFVVQDANTVYVATAAATVIKSITGAFTWGPPVATDLALFGDTIYSLTLIADDQLIVGGNLGVVSYCADGNTTWTLIWNGTPSGGATLVAANGLATGDTIWATNVAANAAGTVASWVIGTNVPQMFGGAGWNVDPAVVTAINGLTYTGGVLYAYQTAGGLDRWLNPAGPFGLAFGASDAAIGGALAVVQVPQINALQASTGSTTIYIRVTGAATVGATDTMQSYTEYVTTAAEVPTPTYPINDSIIAVNSLNGAVNNFTFMWNAPPSQASTPANVYNYDLSIYLDAAGTINVAGSPLGGAAVLLAASGAAALTISDTFPGGGVAFAGVPGTTYYWQVRVAAGVPAQSYWSPMASFVVQQLGAIVPGISSPENGGTITGTMAAFSWTPSAGATSYRFQLSETPDFATTLADETVIETGIAPNVALTPGATYFWRVKAITPNEGDWSSVGNFKVAVPAPPPAPPVVIEQVPAPIITVETPAPPPAIEILPTPPADEIAPGYIWAIIVIGAILVIAVIVLIVRTRRSV